MEKEYKEMKEAIMDAYDMLLEQVCLLRVNTKIYDQKLVVNPILDARGVPVSALIEGLALFDDPEIAEFDEDDEEFNPGDNYQVILRLSLMQKNQKKDEKREVRHSPLETPWILEKVK